MYKYLCIYLLCFLASFCSTSFAQSSVLANGKWYKIGVTQTAIYKLDADFFKSIGLNISQINPKNLHLYGNGGAMLPQPNATPRSQDLVENAIWIKGENDGKFDTEDALYFYGESPHQIKYNIAEKRLYHELNVYSDTTFYFLQIADSQGLRMNNQTSGRSGSIVSTYDEYSFRESELTNRIHSGREWWGEYFGTQTRQEFGYDIADIVESVAQVRVATIAAAQVETKFGLTLNGQNIGSQTMRTVSTFRYDSKGQQIVKNYEAKLTPTNKLTLTINFDKAGQASAEGYLNFFSIQFQRNLKFYDRPTVFQSITTVGQDSVRYQIAQANAQMQVWDITNSTRVTNQLFAINGTTATFGTDAKQLKKFIVFTENQAIKPASVRAIPNQNLRSFATPNLLIITPTTWLNQAHRLASFRQQNDGLSVQVATIEQVYNEFSGGKLDPTAIRDFVRHLYQKQPAQLQYVLLFGDASYDMKNNVKAFSGKELANFIPTYQSRESAHPVLSYSSDDYFGFLENNEGAWEEDFGGNHTLDIGIGRLPAKTPEEAKIVVDKLVAYNTTRTHGKWRQQVAFVADDGDGNLHQKDAEDLASIVNKVAPTYATKKVYIDAFEQVSMPPTQHAPEVNEAVSKIMNDGTLMLNYTGHGGTTIWADEQIVTLKELLNWRSLYNMPLVITATCEFGRYDNPAEMSGAEIAVLNPRGGAIAMLTTARPVYASTNFVLNQAFYEVAFKPINNEMPRLGDIIRLTKNNSLSGVFNRNFTLLGDPSLRLNYPENQINITTKDTLSSGKLVRFLGEITERGKTKTDFTGEATVTVFDKATTIETRGSEAPVMTYQTYETKLYQGKVSVKQGKFEWSFVVPKFIDNTLHLGRAQVYALSTDSLTDAAGANNTVLIGGNIATTLDTKPATLKLYIDDENFVDGSTVAPNSTLIAKLTDENGFNLSKPMTLRLNDTLTVEVNDFFVAHKDDYKSGYIRFPFQSLPVGDYVAVLKIFDAYNNPTEATLRFKVQPQANLVKTIKAFPNPSADYSTLEMELYDEGDDLEVIVQIFDISGKQIVAYSTVLYNTDVLQNIFDWNGKNTVNQRVDSGVYFYRVVVNSLIKNQKQQISGKLIRLK